MPLDCLSEPRCVVDGQGGLPSRLLCTLELGRVARPREARRRLVQMSSALEVPLGGTPEAADLVPTRWGVRRSGRLELLTDMIRGRRPTSRSTCPGRASCTSISAGSAVIRTALRCASAARSAASSARRIAVTGRSFPLSMAVQASRYLACAAARDSFSACLDWGSFTASQAVAAAPMASPARVRRSTASSERLSAASARVLMPATYVSMAESRESSLSASSSHARRSPASSPRGEPTCWVSCRQAKNSFR